MPKQRIIPSLHVCKAPLQPATCFVDAHTTPPHWFHFRPRHLFLTNCCRKRRWARYVMAQVYYDAVLHWCARGHGCKKNDPL